MKQALMVQLIQSIVLLLGKILGWIIDSVIDHTINISKKNLY